MLTPVVTTYHQDYLAEERPTIDQSMVEERAAALGQRRIKAAAALHGLQQAIHMMHLHNLGRQEPTQQSTSTHR